MTRYGMLMVVVASLGCGSGCYYDQWKDCQSALRVTQEDLSRAKTDLLDCEHMNKQKDTQIEALRNQNATLEQTNASLNAENQSLRDALARAQGIAEEMAKKQVGGVTIINRELPKEVADALDRFVQAHPDLVERVGNAVRWKADLLFPLGSDQLATSQEIQGALREFAQIVNSAAAQDLELVVVGHTCTTPIRKPETLREHKTNWHLSAHRAIAVMRMLTDVGVGEARMGVTGYGELRPIADNSTAEGKARNRRVEIFLVPKGSVQGVGGSPGVYESEGAGAFVKPSELGTGTARGAAERAAPARSGTRRVAGSVPPAPPAEEVESDPAY